MPVNWKQGEDVIILPTAYAGDSKAKFPEGWRSLLPYIRMLLKPK